MFICELFNINEDNAWNNGSDLFHSPDQDPWTGQQSKDTQWHNGNDEWHGQNSGNMAEDFAVTNIVTHEDNKHVSLSDILDARALLGRAVRDPFKHKHEYFEFLKHLRNKHGKEYSTTVHQKAIKLSSQEK